ncbi:ABC transporter permease [Corynebacterium aquatimens]|uniref:Iron(III) transport system permease protein n=1 Tax=Corynebacterium aquatimens TaxID=1190508 RepID=A0A931DUL0_9CORY|nr:iron ABC transporter permease [Corynebacterium aquatimens]MBG6121779.1 iron(III) transport system permease protein [Corynebacterium aquatimens]WJY65682.1 Sulfate transport system permease protein CysW [Corynebacterium aquatimens]
MPSLFRVGTWLIAAGVFITPLALVVGLALGGNQIPVLMEQGLPRAAWNSFYSTFLSSVLAVAVGTVGAIVVERTTIRGSHFARMLLLSPLLVPPFVGAIAWIQLFGRNQGFNSFTDHQIWNIYGADGVIFLLTLHAYPIVYVIMAAALRKVPRDLELAARVSGASSWTTLRTVTLPLVRPAILSAFTLTFVSNLGDFGIPALIGSPARFETLATMVYRFVESGTVPNPLQVVSTIGVVLLVMGILAVIADYIVAERAATSGTNASAPLRFELGRATWPLTIVTWCVGLAITVLPVGGLLVRALSPASGVKLTRDTLTWRHFEATLNNPRVIDGFTNSLLLSLSAAIIAGVLGWLIGILVTRTRSRDNTALTLVTLLPSALPGLIVGVGWLIISLYTGLYNTRWIILAAYVCAYTATVLQAVRAPLKGTPIALEEAARISGAGPLRAIFHTSGAMAIPAALSGAVLVAITAVRELTVSVLLIAPGTTTLGVQLFNLQQAGNYNQASALAFLFTIAGLAVLFIASASISRGTAAARR